VVEVLSLRGTGLKRGDGGGFGGTVAAYDKGAKQSRAVAAVLGAGRVPLGFGRAGGRPRRGDGGNGRVLWGHGGGECGGEARVVQRRAGVGGVGGEDGRENGYDRWTRPRHGLVGKKKSKTTAMSSQYHPEGVGGPMLHGINCWGVNCVRFCSWGLKLDKPKS